MVRAINGDPTWLCCKVDFGSAAVLERQFEEALARCCSSAKHNGRSRRAYIYFQFHGAERSRFCSTKLRFIFILNHPQY